MVLSMDKWVGKVAVVTGASAGIGAEIANQLVKQGLKVAGLARRHERVEEMAKLLTSEKGTLVAIKCDMTKEDDILAAFKYIQENLGAVSILINNAGIGIDTSLTSGETEKWKKILDTNLLGYCIATREAIKQMKESNIDGHIIHINSICGHKVFPIENISTGVYFASKHAITALAESLRFEINREKLKIKITSVSPGFVRSEMKQIVFGLNYLGPDEIVLNEEDVADAVIYALSTPPHVNVSELTVQPVGEIY